MGYETLDILLDLIFFIVIRIVPIIFWISVLRFIINVARRTLNHRYFKSNIVVNNELGNYLSNQQKTKKNRYKDVSKEKLALFNTDDIETLKDYFYDIFLRFETAYNNLDYNVMKMISTKQLFQNYYTGITLDLQVGRKRIIDDIQKKKVIIYELDSTIAKQTVSLMIEVSYLNYTIDRNGYVISGNREKLVTESFEVTFRKDFEKNDITKCPNCGASIEGNKCDYCRTTIKNVEFKISNIKKIVEE